MFPTTRVQRCWVHKTANMLNNLPKSQQPKAKSALHEIYRAETKDDALTTFERFIKTYDAKYPKAVDCLSKDRDTRVYPSYVISRNTQSRNSRTLLLCWGLSIRGSGLDLWK